MRTRIRNHKLIVQFLEYMVGGGVYFWSGYVLFAIGYSILHWNWLWAKMMADAVGWTFNFILQRYWVFYDPHNKHSLQITWRYIALTALNFIIDYSIVGGCNRLGITPYIGFFISAGFFTIWNYLWYRFWVFKVQPTDAE